MNPKYEVFELLNRKLHRLDHQIEHFNKFGNFNNSEELIAHNLNIVRRSEILELMNELTYTVDWGVD